MPSRVEQPAVEQHPHRLDGVERDAFGAVEDARAQLVGQTRHEAGEEVVHRVGRERLEVERAEAALARAPGRALVRELGPRQREHEDRVAAGPVEQVLQEVEQARVRPLHVLEDEHGRRLLRQPLEEDAPGGEEVLLVAGHALLEPEQVRQPRLDPRALVRVEDVLGQREPKLVPRGRGLLVLGDAAAHPHHLRERPVGDPVAVREAAAAMPERLAGEAVDVLLELPRQPRLADPGDAVDEHELRAALVGGGVEELLDESQLAVAADERRLEAGRAERPSRSCDDAERAPQLDRLGLALELCSPASSYATAASDARLVVSPTSTEPGSAELWIRDAVLTRSPATMPWPCAPSVTAASPLSTPARAFRLGSSVGTAASSSSAARTARSASSSCATGAPQTAITASPMNFSTVPP